MPVIAAVIVSVGALVGIFLGAAFAAERISAQIDENRVLFEAQLEENRQLQQQQLDAESDRLRMQLDAAEKRLEKQLAEDQAKQDRTELRDTLDEGAELLGQISSQLIDAEIEAEKAEEGDWSGDPEAASKKVASPGGHLETFESIGSYWQRLLLRFDHKDPIPEAVHAAMNAYNQAMKGLNVTREDFDAGHREAFRENRDEFDDGRSEFVGQTRKRFGVREDWQDVLSGALGEPGGAREGPVEA